MVPEITTMKSPNFSIARRDERSFTELVAGIEEFRRAWKSIEIRTKDTGFCSELHLGWQAILAIYARKICHGYDKKYVTKLFGSAIVFPGPCQKTDTRPCP
jgi:hypothetical protein